MTKVVGARIKGLSVIVGSDRSTAPRDNEWIEGHKMARWRGIEARMVLSSEEYWKSLGTEREV